ncbi:MAG: extracellular solute-binding protein [Actinobacteria bacterium]|nr:extracellular solute-binding protein [Actinomycetota bacterium]
MNRQRALVAFSLVAALGLTACAAGENPQTTGSPSAGGQVEIEWWAPNWDEAEANEMVKEFTDDHPNVTVKLVITTWDSMANQIKVALDSGDTPDVITELISRVPLYAEQDQLRDVSSWYTGDMAMDDFTKSAVDAVSVDGTVYGVPFRWDAGSMVYNKDLFEKAGVEVPKTWSELQAVSKTIHDKTGVYAYGWPLGNDRNTQVRWLNGYYTMGGTLERGGTLNAEASQASLELIEQGFKEGYVTPSSLEADNTQLQNLLINGQIAFYFEGAYAIAPIKEGGINVGTAMWPGPDGPAMVSADGFALMVPAGATEAPELQQFVSYLSTPDNQSRMTDTFPARISAASNEKFSDPLLQPFLEQQTDYAFPVPSFAGYEEMIPTIFAAAQSVALGDSTPADANATIVSHAETALGK